MNHTLDDVTGHRHQVTINAYFFNEKKYFVKYSAAGI